MPELQKNRTIIIFSIITIAVSVSVMLGWIFNIPALQQIVPGFDSMVFNAALCFVLFSGILLLTQFKTDKYRAALYLTLALLSTLIALITLLQFLFDFNSGLDQLFVTDRHPITAKHLFAGRMAYNSAIAFYMLGLGFLMLYSQKKTLNLVAQSLFHGVTVLSGMVLMGYLYGVSLFPSVFYISSMATHTAILFFMVSLAASLVNPSIGVTRLFTGNGIGNKMAKRLFLLMIVMVILFGAFKVQTQHYRLFGLDTGFSLLIVCFLLVSLIIIWNTALWLNKIDSQRTAAEAQIKLLNTDLEKKVAERASEYQRSEEKYRSLIEHASDAIYMMDVDGNFIDVNDSMCKMMGYTLDELLQLNIKAIIDPEELKTDPLPKSMADTKMPAFRERRFMHKDGHIFPVEINVKMFPGNMILVIARNITARKKMETELRDAELKFRTIAEKSMMGVYIIQNGEFAYINPVFANAFGYQPEELINNIPLLTLVDDDYHDMLLENIRKRIAGEVESIHYEVKGRKRDGSGIWVDLYGSVATIGNVPSIIGSMIDITERKKAEEELKMSEQKYKFLFESNPLPLWMIDKNDLFIIAANEAAAKLYGYTKDELLTMNVKNFRPKEDQELRLKTYKEELKDLVEDRIIKHIRKDGTFMYVQIIANDIIFDGRPVRLLLTNNVTEKFKAEELLRKSEANLQTILKTTNTAYALFDLELKAVAFNQKTIEFARKEYGLTPQMGDQITDFFHAGRVPKFLNYVGEVLKGKHINYEIDYPQPNGTVYWYDVKLSPLTSDNNQIMGMLLALYDITERKNAEQDLKIAYESIQRHISSIKEMAWKQSHLIRSPLANLKALAQMLRTQPGDSKVLGHFQTEISRLDTILHEMAEQAAKHNISE